MSSSPVQSPMVPKDELDVYQANTKVLNKLKLLVGQKQENETINSQLLELIQHAEELPPSSALNERLELTYSMLIGELSTDEYMKIAREVQEEPSLGWKVLGGFMIGLGVLMAVSGVIFIAAGIATLDFLIAVAGATLLDGSFLSLDRGYRFFSPEKKGAPYRQMAEFCDLKRNASGNSVNYIDDEEDCSLGLHS